ncbi:MAG: hypothetical protein HYV63_31125 [Candidatus Schekmanbacteria bacterium]|nr:hypothetical protein [Candidatus Schekmanbacteria bacterium]
MRNHRVLTLIVAIGWCAVVAADAQATQFWVRFLSDAVDVVPGDGYGIAADIGCTLRAAVQEANALPGADTINVLPGTYRLQLQGTDDTAAAGDLDIADHVTIRCDGAEPCILEAGASASTGIDRVFDIGTGSSPPSVRLENLTVRHGKASAGAGITVYNAQVTLAGVLVTGNWATGTSNVAGGGIYFSGSSGWLRLTDSQVVENDLVIRDGQEGQGAGIRVYAGKPVEITGSVIRDNGVGCSGRPEASWVEGSTG